jgi:hypothetical protein
MDSRVLSSLLESHLGGPNAMFKDFHGGNLPLFSLNFGIVTLLPKELEVKKI